MASQQCGSYCVILFVSHPKCPLCQFYNLLIILYKKEEPLNLSSFAWKGIQFQKKFHQRSLLQIMFRKWGYNVVFYSLLINFAHTLLYSLFLRSRLSFMLNISFCRTSDAKLWKRIFLIFSYHVSLTRILLQCDTEEKKITKDLKNWSHKENKRKSFAFMKKDIHTWDFKRKVPKRMLSKVFEISAEVPTK